MGFATLASGGKSHRRRHTRYSGSGMGLVRNGFGGAATGWGTPDGGSSLFRVGLVIKLRWARRGGLTRR
jgi:hypothetical protein